MKVEEVPASRVAPLLGELRAQGLRPDLEDGVWLGALEGGRLVGVARVLEREGIPMLEDVWVRPDRRARGVASALVSAAKEGRVAGSRPPPRGHGVGGVPGQTGEYQ